MSLDKVTFNAIAEKELNYCKFLICREYVEQSCSGRAAISDNYLELALALVKFALALKSNIENCKNFSSIEFFSAISVPFQSEKTLHIRLL